VAIVAGEMQTALKKLLTQEVVPDGHPLFANAAKLGEAIVALADEHYRNPKTTAALISFVFRGDRPCSDGLRSAIIAATRARLAKQPKRVQDDWVQRIGRTIELQNSAVAAAQEEQSASDEEQFADLLERAERADNHFIITPLTSEQEQGIRRAEQLNEILMRRLGLSPQSEDEPNTTYRFLLPKDDTARAFWLKVRNKAALAENQTWADKRLQWLDTNDRLQVYVVPKFVCGCPIVVFDPEATRDVTAFSFSYHRHNIIDTIQWDAISVREWTENVYKTFRGWATKKEIQEFMDQHPDDFGTTPACFCGYRYRFADALKT